MSTLKTNNIQHVDRSDPSILLNSDGSVSMGGTVSYEDVTNVDSVGIITARSGVNITGGNITLGDSSDGSKKRSKLNVGFLAQEALEIEKANGYGSSKDDMLIVNLNEDETAYGMKYERLVPVLVNAIKELSAEVEQLKSQLNN